MNPFFWSEIQKCWRITLDTEEKNRLQNQAYSVAAEWADTTRIKAYSRNPLDDFDDEDDDEDY